MGFLGDALGTTRGDNDQNQNVGRPTAEQPVEQTPFARKPNDLNIDQEPYREGVDNNLATLSAKDQAEGAAVSAFMRPVTDVAIGNQTKIGGAATGAAGRSFQDYLDTIGAVKSDAMNYDSPEEMERVRQEAAGNANSAFDTAQQSRAIQLAQMGVNPNSGRFADPNALTLQRTMGVADAMNRATAGRKDQAIALRSNVANMTGNAATGFSGVGVNAGKTAIDTGVAGNNAALPWLTAANQPLSTQAGYLQALYGTAAADAGRTLDFNKSMYATAVQDAGNRMNFNAATYGTAVRDAGQTLDYNLGSKRIVSDQVLGAEGLTGKLMSSKSVKVDKRKIDEDAVLKAVKRLPVERWRYKKGVADEGDHIGPYAEDVQRELGDDVAPGGKVIDVISMFGVNLAALQALASKVDRLERR
jgi:hypothetical protein